MSIGFRKWLVPFTCLVLLAPAAIDFAMADAPSAAITRCELVPQPGQQLDFQVDGASRLSWHHGRDLSRPFFYPLIGPGGTSLLRMGHPGAPDHDHHHGIWFAHHDVDGTSFWSDRDGAKIRQTQWYAYQADDNQMQMAVRLDWQTADGQTLMQQDVIAVLTPEDGDHLRLELQSDFRPGAGRGRVKLGKTNFGFLAVRVARSLSARYGGGRLTNSESASGEAAVFGQPARWMDYSGPVASGVGDQRQTHVQGITYFSHPDNGDTPPRWHVRDDGWMAAAFNFESAIEVTQEQPLRLRYLVAVHNDAYDADASEQRYQAFAATAGWELRKSTDGRTHYRVERN